MHLAKLRKQPIFQAVETLAKNCPGYFSYHISHDDEMNLMECEVTVDLAALHLAMATALPAMQGKDVWPESAANAFAQLYRMYHLDNLPVECSAWKKKCSFTASCCHHMVPRIVHYSSPQSLVPTMSPAYFEKVIQTIADAKSTAWQIYCPCASLVGGCYLKFNLGEKKGPAFFDFDSRCCCCAFDGPSSVSSRFLVIDRVARSQLEEIVQRYALGPVAEAGCPQRTMLIFCPSHYTPFWHIVCKNSAPSVTGEGGSTKALAPVASRTRSRRTHSLTTPRVPTFTVIPLGTRSFEYFMQEDLDDAATAPAAAVEEVPDVVLFHNCSSSFAAHCVQLLEKRKHKPRVYLATVSSIRVAHEYKFLTKAMSQLIRTLVSPQFTSSTEALQHVVLSAGTRYHNYFLHELLFRKVKSSRSKEDDDGAGSPPSPKLAMRDIVVHLITSGRGADKEEGIDAHWHPAEYRPALKAASILRDHLSASDAPNKEEDATEFATCACCAVAYVSLYDNVYATCRPNDYDDDDDGEKRNIVCTACLVHGSGCGGSSGSSFSFSDMTVCPQARHWDCMPLSIAKIIKTLYYSFVAKHTKNVVLQSRLQTENTPLPTPETWIVFVDTNSMYQTFMHHVVPLFDTRWRPGGRASHLVKAHWLPPNPTRAFQVVLSAKRDAQSGVPLVILFCSYYNYNLSVYDIPDIKQVFCTKKRIPDGDVWPRISDKTKITFLVESKEKFDTKHQQAAVGSSGLPRAPPPPPSDSIKITSDIIMRLHKSRMEDILRLHPG